MTPHLAAAPDPEDRPEAPEPEGQEPEITQGRHNLAAEQAVLGAVLVTAGRALDDPAVAVLTPADFWRTPHGDLLALMRRMHADREPCDAVALSERMYEPGAPTARIPLVYLAELSTAIPTAANVGYHARIVAACARARRLTTAGHRIMLLGQETPVDALDEAQTSAYRLLSEVGTPGADAVDVVDMASLVESAMERWESPESGVMPTHIPDLDRSLLGGLRPGHFLVIGARPGVGKTVLACVLAHKLAETGLGVFFATLEMSDAEITDRIVADVAGVELSRLTQRVLREEDWGRVSDAHYQVGKWNLRILDRAGLSLAQLAAHAREAARSEPGLDVVIVDYLQLMRPADARVPRQEQVAAISRGLKELAKDLGITVVALSQVNRGPVMRADKAPTMADLRESGAIEADADEIILLHRDDEQSPGEISLIIEKNRHGRTGCVDLSWAPHYSRIR